MKLIIIDKSVFYACIATSIFLMIPVIILSVFYDISYRDNVCIIYNITEIEQDLYSGYYKFNIFYSVDGGMCKNKTKEFSLRNEKK